MRIGAPSAEKPVVRVDDSGYVDVSDIVADFNEGFFAAGGAATLAAPVAERIAAGDVVRFGAERIGAPIARPHQILCIGLNYRDHAAETGQAVLAAARGRDGAGYRRARHPAAARGRARVRLTGWTGWPCLPQTGCKRAAG